MPQATFLIDDRVVPVASGETLLHASLRAGIPHAHACGGHARCSTCRVSVVDGVEHCAPRTSPERALADRLGFTPEVRLACQLMLTGDVTVRRLVLDDRDLDLADMRTDRNPLAPIGEERPLAIMFADIRGFTAFAEPLMPYDVVHALNRYYDAVGRAIAEYHGVIDNYMGDGLLALFGFEEPAAGVAHAVAAAHAMIAAVEQLKPYFETVYGRSFDIGIGIHYGEVIVGAVGSAGHRRVTAIGDAVNVASRIETATKTLGARILVSHEARAALGAYGRGSIAHRVTLPGRSGEFVLYDISTPPEAEA